MSMNMSKTLVVFMLMVLAWFMLSIILWALWNATIPKLTESIAGGPTSFENLSFSSGLLFGLLVIFLAVPISGCHKMVTNYNFVELSGWSQPQSEIIELEEL